MIDVYLFQKFGEKRMSTVYRVPSVPATCKKTEHIFQRCEYARSCRSDRHCLSPGPMFPRVAIVAPAALTRSSPKVAMMQVTIAKIPMKKKKEAENVCHYFGRNDPVVNANGKHSVREHETFDFSTTLFDKQEKPEPVSYRPLWSQHTPRRTMSVTKMNCERVQATVHKSAVP